jgi:histone H3/H4
MAKKKGKSSDAMIISKARVKAAVKKCNVGADFYDALEAQVRDLIAAAEKRAVANKRKTLKAADA